MRLFQFAAFIAPLVSARRAAGGKFNGRFRRNAPPSFITSGKCDEMCLIFERLPIGLKTLLSCPPRSSDVVFKQIYVP